MIAIISFVVGFLATWLIFNLVDMLYDKFYKK